MGDALFGVEQVGPAHQIFKLGDTQLGHDLTHLFGHKEEVIHHMLGLALKLLTKHRILGGHPHRTGVEVALTHHDAARGHQRRGGKAHLIGAQERANHDIAAGLHLAIGLHPDTTTQAIEHERLLGLCQTDLPGRARMLDRCQR